MHLHLMPQLPRQTPTRTRPDALFFRKRKGGLLASFFLPVSLPREMEHHVLIPPAQFALILDRLAHQLIEHHDFQNTDLVGLQPGVRVLPSV